MRSQNRGGSELVDPLKGHHPFPFLLPAAKSSDGSFDSLLAAVHDHLNSATVSDKSRQLAKSLVEEGFKALSSKTAPGQGGMKKSSEVLPVVAEVKPRERRPGLDRKRARFSLKPDSSQSAVSIESALDVKSLKDPEEFFKAFERHENAKKEIRRQMGGVLLDSELQNTSLTNRPRRPGMQGLNKRKSIKYKHLYPSEDSEANNNNVLSSQEQFDSDILSPRCLSSQPENGIDFASQGPELAGSTSPEVDKVDEILDELLSYTGEELDGDRAINILQERLKIKSIKLQKLNIPDFPSIPKMTLKPVTSGKLRFSSITHMKHKQGVESSIPDVTSPIPSKSPFASLPLLNQRISHSSSSYDPFSADDIDREPVRSPTVQVGNEFADVRRQSDNESPFLEKDENIECFETDASKLDNMLDAGPSSSQLSWAMDMDVEMNADNEIMNEAIAIPYADGSTEANETNVQSEVRYADGSTEANETNVQDEVLVEDQPPETVPEQPCPDTMELALDDGLEKDTEVSLPKQPKEKSRSRKVAKRRVDHRRKSLAGAGSKWESGLRRSSRIKCRPLEYWNGERLLYGRIHKTLPTVIGVKYASPGNHVLKVKSYVSEKYKELVEMAALH